MNHSKPTHHIIDKNTGQTQFFGTLLNCIDWRNEQDDPHQFKIVKG